jgi:hypothetical protein
MVSNWLHFVTERARLLDGAGVGSLGRSSARARADRSVLRG